MQQVVVGFEFMLALVLVRASIPKLLAASDFAIAVANYGLLPQRLVSPIARALPWIELALAAALFGGLAPRLTAATTALLFGGFAVAVSINLLRGRRIECGCEGTAAPREITWGLVAKDALLAVLALGIAADSTAARVTDLAVDEAVALLIAASLLVAADSLVSEARRVRSAERAFRALSQATHS